MAGLLFEWDSDKAESNLRKHGVSFEEAETLFADPDEVMFPIRITASTKNGSSVLDEPHRAG